MPLQARDITIGSNTYKIWFTLNALRRLELTLGISYWQLQARLMNPRVSLGDLQALLYAGLEGARLKLTPRRPEWTIDRVGDLFDELEGGFIAWAGEGDNTTKVIGAFYDTLPKPKPKTDDAKNEAAADTPPQDPPSAATPGGTN